jgi:cell division inhibitor SepF
MALRDTWHRTLVYFGLAEDRYDDEDDYDPPTPAPASRAASTVNAEAEIEERYRERPNVRRMPSRRRRDDFDDIFAEEGGSSRTNVLRAVGSSGTSRPTNGRSDVRVHLVSPRSFNDAQDVADKFKDAIPVIINLQQSEAELNKRLIDFASGLTYALDGGMQRIADKVFLLTPRNVEVSAEERARILEKGFFNQS